LGENVQGFALGKRQIALGERGDERGESALKVLAFV
jgi:hypothetical protein